MKLRKRLYMESDDSTMSIENFDYAKLKFPDKVDAQVMDSGGGEYEMYSEEFDYINEDVLGANGISFVFNVEVNGHWYGKYYPATLETPEEFPEFEIDDSSVELVRIMFNDGSEKPIDITDKFPSKEQAIKDGNEQWYKEYDWFTSILGEAAEEAECENVSENPPEEEPDYYDYDDRDRYDYYESRRRFSENTIPQELRDKAMAAQSILKNNASLSDSELKAFIRRAKMMHRDELVQAAEDLLEYRSAAEGLSGDREDNDFAGIASDFDESSEDIDDEDEDGWNNNYLEDTNLSYVLAAISDLDYEIKHCVRGGNTGCKTYEELGDYIISLGEQLSEAGEDVKYIR